MLSNPDRNGFARSAASQGSLEKPASLKRPSSRVSSGVLFPIVIRSACGCPTRLSSLASLSTSPSRFVPPLKSRPLMMTSEPARFSKSVAVIISPLTEVAGILNRSVVPLDVNASAMIRTEKPLAGPETKDNTRPPNVPLKLSKLPGFSGVNGVKRRGSSVSKSKHILLGMSPGSASRRESNASWMKVSPPMKAGATAVLRETKARTP